MAPKTSAIVVGSSTRTLWFAAPTPTLHAPAAPVSPNVCVARTLGDGRETAGRGEAGHTLWSCSG